MIGHLLGIEKDSSCFDNTGLTYIKHRYYDSEVGRFISRDPIGYLGGFNLYNYVRNNPVRYVDPEGLVPIIAIGGVVLTIAEVLCILHTFGEAMTIRDRPGMDKVAHCFMVCQLANGCRILPDLSVWVGDLIENGSWGDAVYDPDDKIAHRRGKDIFYNCTSFYIDCEKECEKATKDLN